MENVTIRILARQLQLSAATVSKALADSHEISQATKKRVLEMAAAMNYTPNPYASSLRKKKSKTIAVILPEVADSFFAEAINGIEEVAQEKGYHVLICLTHERSQILRTACKLRTPNHSQKPGVIHRRARMCHQIVQQVELFGREVDRLARLLHNAPRRIELDVANADLGIGRG